MNNSLRSNDFDDFTVRIDTATPGSSHNYNNVGRGVSFREYPISSSASERHVDDINWNESISQLENGIRGRWGPPKPVEKPRRQSFFEGNVNLLDVKSGYSFRKKGILKTPGKSPIHDKSESTKECASFCSDASAISDSSKRSVAFKEPSGSHTLFSVYEEYKRSEGLREKKNSFSEIRKKSVYTLKNLISPNQNANTIKVFGSAVEVELERKRAFDAGYIIHPLSRLKYLWDLLMLVLLIINLYILPLDIAFFETYTLMPFHIISDCIFFLDILINFRTGFHLYADKYELDSKAIAIHYLKTWFFVDFLSSLPLNYIVVAATSERAIGASTITSATRALKVLKICKILNVLKLLRLLRFTRLVTEYGDAYHVTISIMRYVKLFSTMLLLCHWNGCLHYFVALLQDFPERCWVKTNNLFHEPWYIKYGWAMFTTISHMLVIGYGRQMPLLLSEAFVAMVTMITGATFYALLITNAVASRVSSSCSRQLYNEKVKETDEYLLNKDIPRSVQERVDEFFQQKYPQGKYVSEKEILSVVSPPLRDSIVQHTCQYLIQNIPFLRDSTPESVFAMFGKVDSNVYLIGDTIVQEGRIGKDMFFVRSGEVVLTLDSHELETLGPGTYFGEISVLTNQRQLYSVVTTRPSDIMILHKEDLDDLLAEHPKMNTLLYCAALQKLIHIYQLSQQSNVDINVVLGIRSHDINSEYCEATNDTTVTFYELFLRSMETLVKMKYAGKRRGSDTRENNLIKKNELETLISDVLLSHQLSHPSCTLIAHGAVCGSSRYRDESFVDMNHVF